MKQVLGKVVMSLVCMQSLMSVGALAETRDRDLSSMELIATTTLDRYSRDTDVLIPAGECPSSKNPAVEGLQLRAVDAAAKIEKLQILTEDGIAVDLQIQGMLRQGMMTDLIDLPGKNGQCIEKIRIIGTTLDNRGPLARIEIFGKRDKSMYDERVASILGSITLDAYSDRDVLSFGMCNGANAVNRANAVQILVKNASAEIERLVIEFANGTRQELQVRSNFEANSTSRIIDLQGETRCISKVMVKGRSLNLRRDARVTVIGYRPTSTESVIANTQLDYARDADLISFQTCASGRTLDAVRLEVTRGQAQVNKLVIELQNGEREMFLIQSKMSAGQSTDKIDLNGGARCIRKVGVMGRTLPASTDNAVVKIIGISY